MARIDLNCDMAELHPATKANHDDEIMPYISSCNISCGFHSGNPALIEKTIRSAIFHKRKIGAHPSYDDAKHFGRSSIAVDPAVLFAQLRYQVAAIKGMVESLGSKLNHVKPHGALYNDMMANSIMSKAFVRMIKELDPKLEVYGLAGSEMKKVCEQLKVKFVSEAFADRRYQSKTELRSRDLEDSVIHEPDDVLRQVDFLLSGKVQLFSSEMKDIEVETICLHSDTRGALALCKLINQHLQSRGIEIR